ncbi:BgTH12-05273 [Blumeria graminis f. sp. triticale]|jgi:hypothetical protein
MSLS